MTIERMILMKRIISIFVFLFIVIATMVSYSGPMSIAYFIDLPTLVIILVLSISMLFFSDQWQDFMRGLKISFLREEATTKELKSSLSAICSFRSYAIYAGLITILTGITIMLRYLEDSASIGPALSVAILPLFYVAIGNIVLTAIGARIEKEIIYREN